MDSEQTPPMPEIVPMEGESYYAAYQRQLGEMSVSERYEDDSDEVLGVLTGVVPVGSTTSSMPIAPVPASPEDEPESTEDTEPEDEDTEGSV